MAFDKIVGVDGTTYNFPSAVRTKISSNITTAGQAENTAVASVVAAGITGKSDTTHNHDLANLTNNILDALGDVEIGVNGSNGIAIADKHTLQYEASTAKWRNKVASGGVTVGATRPTSAIPGDAWFDSNDGTLYVYYSDGNSFQWVQVKANSALEGTILSRLGALESRTTALEAVPDFATNNIINGAFEINQRAFTTSTDVSGVYTFDRWKVGANGSTVTTSAQTFATSDTLATTYGAKNYIRMVTSGQSASSNYAFIAQRMEDVSRLAGRTVTISFWARAAGGAPQVAINLQNQYNSTTWLRATAQKVTLSTSWARYSVTISVPSVSGRTLDASNTTATDLEFWVSAGADHSSYTGSLGLQANTFEFWGVQVEEGSVATPFHRNAPSIQGELAACQRYYQRVVAEGSYGQLAVGWGYTSTQATAWQQFKVAMRTRPTSIEYSGVGIHDNYSSVPGVTSLTIEPLLMNSNVGNVTVVSSGLTISRPYWIGGSNNTAAYLAFSAEL